MRWNRRFCIDVVYKDSGGDPNTGRQLAIDLVEKEKVVALNGAYDSSVTESIRGEANRLGIPFLNGESVLDDLNNSGPSWFFRTTPTFTEIAKLYADFLKNIKGYPFNKIAVVYETGRYGEPAEKKLTETFKNWGINIEVLPVSYDRYAINEQIPDRVGQLSKGKPDVVIFMSYGSDATKFAEVMNNVGYKPPMMIADEAGFSDPDFIRRAGSIAKDMLMRSSWIVDERHIVPYRVNEMYKKKSKGLDLDSATARTMQGFMVLAGAIRRAQSTKPEEIRNALLHTNLKSDQLIAHYAGVKFNEMGLNTMCNTPSTTASCVLLTQLQGTGNDLKPVPVWPEKEATEADAKLVLPDKR